MSRRANIIFFSIVLLIAGLLYSYYGTFKMTASYDYSTTEIEGTFPFRGTIEIFNGQTIRTLGGGGKFWFNKDAGYKHFDFEVVEMTNIYGSTILITEL